MKRSSLCAFAFASLLCGSCNSSTSSNNTNNNNNGGPYKASGSITVVVHCDNTATEDLGNGYINSKNEVASSNLVVTCGQVSGAGTSKSFQWQNATLSGTSSDLRYEKIQYPCTSGGTAYDYDTLTNSFSSSSDGEQPSGASLTVVGSAYSISSTAAWTGTPVHTYHSHATNCGTPTFTNASGNAFPVPWETYFSPFFGGGNGMLTGTIDPANPNQIKGTLHGTDNLTLYTNGTTSYTVPIDIVISWSFTIQ
jgi:hypothetical protein